MICVSALDCNEKEHFLNFGTVFLTAVNSRKLRKAHCSPPLVGEDNSMVFTTHLVPFPATRDLWSFECEVKTIELSSPTSGGEQ